MTALEIALEAGDIAPDDWDPVLADMKQFPKSTHTREEVANAGKIIAARIPVSGTKVPPEIEKAFLVANSWRDAHAYPMRSIRSSMRHFINALRLKGLTAARLKRMQAIRRKLQRMKDLSLDEIQDFGGCRVILSSIDEVRSLATEVKNKLPSEVIDEDDYIAKPKKSGYRSHHIILGFRKQLATPFDGKKIELQIRTRLQHSWATAVEAVGLYRGEELKNGKGDPSWLRMFALMSAHFAEVEGCKTVRGTPDHPASRSAEIKRLAASLKALQTLENVNNGLDGTDIKLAPGSEPTHFLIRYDHEHKKVSVEPYSQVSKATASYDREEAVLRGDDEKDVVVLVEADKIKGLKEAYPNYFGDTKLFISYLREIVHGPEATAYARAAKQRRGRPPAQQDPRGDLSWLRGSRFRGPSNKRMKRKS